MQAGGLKPFLTTRPGERGGMRAAGGVNAALAAGTFYGKGPADGPVSKHDLQLTEDQVPILTSGMPVGTPRTDTVRIPSCR